MTSRFFLLLSLLCISSAVLGGTPFSQFADVGPVSSWPHPTTVAFHNNIDRLVNNRLAESQLIRLRVRYIRQAFDGSAVGGGTDGLSPQTAWKCRTMADVRALLTAQMLPDTTILFRNGDTFYSVASNTLQGIPRFQFGNYTLSSYIDPSAPSLSKPRLLGFYRLNPTELHYVSPQTYYIKTPCIVHWVRGRRLGTDAAYGYRDVPYNKQPDIAFVGSFERSWAIDTSRHLYINIGTQSDVDDTGTLEAQVSTGPGIMVGDVDDVRIDNLIVEGWGIDIPAAGDGAIRADASGTNALTVTRCEWGWTAYHGLLHGTSSSGGILLVQDCSFGYHVNRDSANGGGGDGLVCFARGGGNEMVIDNCRSFGGGLSRIGVSGASGSNLGMPVYQHALAGLNIALHVRRNCNFTPIHPTRAHFADYFAAGDAVATLSGNAAELPADPLDVRHYRAFVINETAQFEGTQFGGGWRAVDINCKMRCSIGGYSSGIYFFWGGLRNAYGGMSINRDIEFAFDPAFRAFYALSQATIIHNHAFIHARIRLTGTNPLVPNDFFLCEVDPAKLATSRLFGSVISNETHASGLRWNYPNADSMLTAGGMSHCAFYNIPASTFNQSRSPVTLPSPANYLRTQPQTVPQALVGRASTLPGGLRLEYDTNMQPRPLHPTLGPVEGVESDCPADFNNDSIVDFFDYLDFTSEWAVDSPTADVNADSIIDLFDYLDFVADFSQGC